jgi:site-specific recombinase XerD
VTRARRKEHRLASVPEHYRGFFDFHSRVKSTEHRQVGVVKAQMFEEFLLAVSNDSSINQPMRILICLILSAGLRITEALSLQRISFEREGGQLYFYFRVLKKSSYVERKAIVHPAIKTSVEEYLLKFRSFDKLFAMDRHQALYAIKCAFGKSLDLHALRHSHISYLLFYKELPLENVSSLVKLSSQTVKLYSHLDPTPLLAELYSERINSQKKKLR